MPDTRMIAWELVDALPPHQAATWDSTLRGLEDEYVSEEVWLEVVSTLRWLTYRRLEQLRNVYRPSDKQGETEPFDIDADWEEHGI